MLLLCIFQDDTSGDYQSLLLDLIGDRPATSPTAEEIEAAAPPELEELEDEDYPVSTELGQCKAQPCYFSLNIFVSLFLPYFGLRGRLGLTWQIHLHGL